MTSMPFGDTVRLMRVNLLPLAEEKARNQLVDEVTSKKRVNGNEPLAADMTLLTASLVACVELAVSTIVSPRCFTAKVLESASSIVSGRSSPRSRKLVARAHSSQSSGGSGKGTSYFVLFLFNSWSFCFF